MLKSLAIIISIAMFQPAFSHDDHDHGPSQAHAPKGGLLRSLETVHLELLSQGNTITIYAYDMNLKPEEVKKFRVSATVTLPKKTAQPLTLTDKGDHWEANFDAKGSHRYTLVLSIKQGGHSDKVKFTVEPKK